MRDIDIPLTFDEDTNLGFLKNEWVTLNGFCERIGLYSNSVLFVKPLVSQYYFDTSAGLLFIRRTTGKPILSNISEAVPEGYVKVEVNGKYYLVKLLEGGIKDDTIGTYHEVVSIDNITGFYN